MRESGEMVRRFVVLLVMATLAASCGLGQSSDPPASSKSRVKVSYILGYENLTDQILDADLVVLGTAADVETGGVNRDDDGSGVTDRTMGITVHIDEVLRSSLRDLRGLPRDRANGRWKGRRHAAA
jgi:hypothetical protein